MPITKLQWIYLGLAVLGLCVTWYFNLQFLLANEGFFLSNFVQDLYVNIASTSITNDIAVASSVFMFWMLVESRRLKMPYVWAHILVTCCIAFAVALPLFLFHRERYIQAQELAS